MNANVYSTEGTLLDIVDRLILKRDGIKAISSYDNCIDFNGVQIIKKNNINVSINLKDCDITSMEAFCKDLAQKLKDNDLR